MIAQTNHGDRATISDEALARQRAELSRAPLSPGSVGHRRRRPRPPGGYGFWAGTLITLGLVLIAGVAGGLLALLLIVGVLAGWLIGVIAGA